MMWLIGVWSGIQRNVWGWMMEHGIQERSGGNLNRNLFMASPIGYQTGYNKPIGVYGLRPVSIKELRRQSRSVGAIQKWRIDKESQQ
jgi:hypothetical protein